MKRHQTFVLNCPQFQALAERVPAEGLLFNAARPLAGDAVWQSDFQHGIFYAVVCRDNPERARLIAEDLASDAWLLCFISVEEARARTRNWLATMFHKDAIPEDLFEAAWQESFYAAQSVREIRPEDIV